MTGGTLVGLVLEVIAVAAAAFAAWQAKAAAKASATATSQAFEYAKELRTAERAAWDRLRDIQALLHLQTLLLVAESSAVSDAQRDEAHQVLATESIALRDFLARSPTLLGDHVPQRRVA